MEPSSNKLISGSTISDALDRLQVGAGRIGMNSAGQAFDILAGMDIAWTRMQELEDSPSLSLLETQFESILAQLRSEAAQFLRDLGGQNALRERRAQVNPPREHVWWYLDEFEAQRRADQTRRTLIGLGVFAAVLIALVVIYRNFLAPDPAVSALYASQQSTQDRMIAGDYPAALQKVEEGLAVVPNDPALLVLKGVIQEQLGQQAEAQASFEAARAGVENPGDFLIERGQAYLMVNQVEKALVDAEQAVEIAPDSPHAYLLVGQVYEVQGRPQEALAVYDQAYRVAEENELFEMAALARTRTAMLMQSMNAILASETATPTP